MSERLVTEADLGTPDIVCECGHNAQFHPGGPVESVTDFHADWDQWAKGEQCPCRKTKDGVRLAHLDSIVRREVAKALVDAAGMLRARGEKSGLSRSAYENAAYKVRDLAAHYESGGQS